MVGLIQQYFFHDSQSAIFYEVKSGEFVMNGLPIPVEGPELFNVSVSNQHLQRAIKLKSYQFSHYLDQMKVQEGELCDYHRYMIQMNSETFLEKN